MKDGNDHHKEMQDALHEYRFELHVGNDNDPLEMEAHGDHESTSPLNVM